MPTGLIKVFCYNPTEDTNVGRLISKVNGKGDFSVVDEHCILVIEDQEDLAELYEAALKEAGYKVRNAYTGEEGLAEFQANGADLILLDMTLPEMNGAQVLRAIRAINANIPIIIVTGETSDDLRQQCQMLGVQEYLSKPPDYDAMLAAIERSLESPQEEAEIITLRLTKPILSQLSEVDTNIERAIIKLLDERERKAMKAEM
jgi:DNA-binding response OmpR family regulator